MLAEGWTQDQIDKGLLMFVQGVGGDSSGDLLAGATSGMGNILGQDSSNPWGSLAAAIASYQYGPGRNNNDDDGGGG